MHLVTFYNLWSLFLIAQLTEVMRQKEDQTFIDLLNKIRAGQGSNDNRIQIQQRTINIRNSTPDATLIYAENNYNKI